jgi:lipopolysaccharide/colanic/teichoic acid biosynthesis glycosyltransferase
MVFIVTGVFMLLVFLLKGARSVFIDSRFVIVFNMFIFMILTLAVKLFLLPALFVAFYGGKRKRRSNLLIAGNPPRNLKIAALLKKSGIYASEERVVQWSVPLPDTPDEISREVGAALDRERCSGAILLFDHRHTMDCIAETCILMHDTGVPFVIYGNEILDLGYFDPWFSLEDYGALAFIRTVNRPGIVTIGRFYDVLLAGIALLALSPVLLLIAAMVKLTSKGPVLFRQERVGKGMRVFQFLKFRSMRQGKANEEQHREYFREYARGNTADAEGETFKLDQTSRVTTIGRFIRKTSLDEFPQLLNVMKGDMAIVGPRPCIPYELEHYKGWQRRRFMIKPGLTGIWQVYGRSRLPFDKAQFLDFLYTIDASHSLDFRLVVKTIPVILFGKGGL